MKQALFLIAVFSVLLFSCSENQANTVSDIDDIQFVNDAHSYSNVSDIRTKHLHLDLEVNFENKTVYGVARHQMSSHTTDTAVFDIKEIKIQKVTLGKDNEVNTDFVIGKHDSILGQSLKVVVEPTTTYINIYYQTTKATEALDWLPPSLTEGKEHPFMYTQGQAILTRSWIPLQDTPLNRISYSADVKVPNDLLAVMSASNPTTKNEEGSYHFEMDQKIPSYLIALAVGNLEYISIGDNCGIYAEPELAEQCKYEFADLPTMISSAQNLYGPYQWDQYDMVMLPYSFPFGGMENPRLTFANPTLLAGDRSLVSVVAHELAHSWSGNLVTNATWNDFWLNEGFTVYFENRIMEKIYGKETADILALIEFQDLEVALEDMENGEHPEDTQLKLTLDGRNPDDGMTDIAYVKGAYFLRTIEKEVGRGKFDAFLKNYFDSHAFKTITTEEFVSYIEEELFKPNGITFNTEEWIYQPGLPKNCIQIESKRLKAMSSYADEINETKLLPKAFSKLEREDRITQEWQTFIRSLDPMKVSHEQIKNIDSQLRFSEESNPALKSDWFKFTIAAKYSTNKPQIEAYLMKIGRRWFIEGIYQHLKDNGEADHEWAKQVFAKAKDNYHFVSRSTIQDILN